MTMKVCHLWQRWQQPGGQSREQLFPLTGQKENGRMKWGKVKARWRRMAGYPDSGKWGWYWAGTRSAASMSRPGMIQSVRRICTLITSSSYWGQEDVTFGTCLSVWGRSCQGSVVGCGVFEGKVCFRLQLCCQSCLLRQLCWTRLTSESYATSGFCSVCMVGNNLTEKLRQLILCDYVQKINQLNVLNQLMELKINHVINLNKIFFKRLTATVKFINVKDILPKWTFCHYFTTLMLF